MGNNGIIMVYDGNNTIVTDSLFAPDGAFFL